MRTSELTGVALDWAVAKCEGVAFESYCAAVAWMKRREVSDDELSAQHAYQYSTGWAQGGPIIERARILFHGSPGAYHAWIPDNPSPNGDGETHLIAAMRCFAASRLGDEVEVPEELL